MLHPDGGLFVWASCALCFGAMLARQCCHRAGHVMSARRPFRFRLDGVLADEDDDWLECTAFHEPAKSALTCLALVISTAHIVEMPMRDVRHRGPQREGCVRGAVMVTYRSATVYWRDMRRDVIRRAAREPVSERLK
jgi:hypothetical protein